MPPSGHNALRDFYTANVSLYEGLGTCCPALLAVINLTTVKATTGKLKVLAVVACVK